MININAKLKLVQYILTGVILILSACYRGVGGTLLNIYDEAFFRKELPAK